MSEEPSAKRIKVEIKAEDGMDIDDNDATHSAVTHRGNGRGKASAVCPFLDTVNRALLDFDFEKVCSVSLGNLNVYACLVCGKYFQGGRNMG